MQAEQETNWGTNETAAQLRFAADAALAFARPAQLKPGTLIWNDPASSKCGRVTFGSSSFVAPLFLVGEVNGTGIEVGFIDG